MGDGEDGIMGGVRFSFEDLEVWQEAVVFADLCIAAVENLSGVRKHYRLIEQLESASASISLNIAEGKGQFSKKEFIHFLYIARGSLFETVTILEIFRRRSWIKEAQFYSLKQTAIQLGKRISALINSLKKP